MIKAFFVCFHCCFPVSESYSYDQEVPYCSKYSGFGLKKGTVSEVSMIELLKGICSEDLLTGVRKRGFCEHFCGEILEINLEEGTFMHKHPETHCVEKFSLECVRCCLMESCKG